jgi:hypothetical protein
MSHILHQSRYKRTQRTHESEWLWLSGPSAIINFRVLITYSDILITCLTLYGREKLKGHAGIEIPIHYLEHKVELEDSLRSTSASAGLVR